MKKSRQSKQSKRVRSEEDRFAARLVERIRGAGEKRPVRYDRGAFALSAGRDHRLSLERLYRLHQQAPRAEKEPLVQRIVRFWFLVGAMEAPPSYEAARPCLLPVLRGLDFEGGGAERKGPAEVEVGDMVFRPFPGGVGIHLVYDLPEAMAFVGRQALADWKVTFEDALAAALDNLRSRSRKPLERVASGVWGTPCGDDYDSSRLLLPELLDRYEVKGELVAMVPRWDLLLVTGTEELEGLVALAHLGGACWDDARGLCPVPLRRNGDSWLPYQPPEEHPAHLPLRLFRVRWQARQYNAQADRLNQRFRARGEKPAAAPVAVLLDRDEHRADTRCDWGEGEDLLLAPTDLVRFCRGKGVLGEARWDRVLEVMGDALEPQGLCLERYRACRFPTPEQLRRMCR